MILALPRQVRGPALLLRVVVMRQGEQPSLFDQPRQVDQGVASRNETFRQIAGELPDRQQRVMLRIIAAGYGGVTLDELSQQMNCEPNKISGRITELKKRGLVAHTRNRRVTRAGSTAAVIVATKFLTR